MRLIRKRNKFNKTLLKVNQYAESEFHTFEFVICEFNVVYMNTVDAGYKNIVGNQSSGGSLLNYWGGGKICSFLS